MVVAAARARAEDGAKTRAAVDKAAAAAAAAMNRASAGGGAGVGAVASGGGGGGGGSGGGGEGSTAARTMTTSTPSAHRALVAEAANLEAVAAEMKRAVQERATSGGSGGGSGGGGGPGGGGRRWAWAWGWLAQMIVLDAWFWVGLDPTFHHVIVVRQNTVQLMTASMFHVTNLTPGSECNPSSGPPRCWRTTTWSPCRAAPPTPRTASGCSRLTSRSSSPSSPSGSCFHPHRRCPASWRLSIGGYFPSSWWGAGGEGRYKATTVFNVGKRRLVSVSVPNR
jgi:hypothetical protein